MTGPHHEPLTDRELDALLSHARVPAPSADLADRIVAEAARVDRVPALPAKPPRRVKRPWTRRSMVVGIIALNLFAASAIAAALHGGEGFKRLSALSSHVFHSITAVIAPHRAEHRVVRHAPIRPAAHVPPRPVARFAMPPQPQMRIAPAQPVTRMPVLRDRPRWQDREMRHPALARAQRRQLKVTLRRDRALDRRMLEGRRHGFSGPKGDRQWRPGLAPRQIERGRGRGFGRDSGMRPETGDRGDRLGQQPRDFAPNNPRQGADNPDRTEPRATPDRFGPGRMAPGPYGRRNWRDGWGQRRAMGRGWPVNRRGPARRWR